MDQIEIAMDAFVEIMNFLVDKFESTEDKIALDFITSKQNHTGLSRHASITSDVEYESVESVGSKPCRPSESTSDRSWPEEQRRPYVATPETTSNIDISTQKIRTSVISPLEEFSGKERDEDRARSWIGRVKSAFLRDQTEDPEKCLIFSDLLTGPAQKWYA